MRKPEAAGARMKADGSGGVCACAVRRLSLRGGGVVRSRGGGAGAIALGSDSPRFAAELAQSDSPAAYRP